MTRSKGGNLYGAVTNENMSMELVFLFAPHVEIEEYTEHLPARILSAKVNVRGLHLAMLNMYSPTDTTKSEATKSIFYSSLNKAKDQLDQNPRYKVITLGDFNGTISATSKNSGAWDAILGPNNPAGYNQMTMVKGCSNGVYDTT